MKWLPQREPSPDWDPDVIRDYRLFARQFALTASALALLAIPAYHVAELFEIGTTSALWWQNSLWRALAVTAAIAALAWCATHRNGYGAPTALRLLATSIMVMMCGLYAGNHLAAEGDAEAMTRGLIIVTFVVALMSLRGARDLLLSFAVPMGGMLAALGRHGESMPAVIAGLFDVFATLVIAIVLSELLSQARMRSFILQKQLREHATTDPLTGLNNRRAIKPQLHSEIARARRHGSTFTVVMADLDHFKRINDDYGHNIGDGVLQMLAGRLRAAIRQEDRPVRWGGEEFLVFMPEIGSEQARVVAERIRHEVGGREFDIEGYQLPITISLGVAEYAGENDPDTLIKRADAALYEAKQTGRDRVCVAGGGEAAA